MPKLIVLLLGMLALNAFSQDLKPLDYSPVFKKNHISKRVCKEVRQNASKADTLTVGIAYFDQEGRVSEYHEFFAGGRLYAIYTYSYDAQNRMSSAQVRHTFYQMEPVEMKVELNASGKVSALTLAQPIRNFWTKQTFTYNEKNVMTRSEQWFDRDGVPTSLNRKDYAPHTSPMDNSLTHLYDQRGLEIVHQFYNATGNVERSWLYWYE